MQIADNDGVDTPVAQWELALRPWRKASTVIAMLQLPLLPAGIVFLARSEVQRAVIAAVAYGLLEGPSGPWRRSRFAGILKRISSPSKFEQLRGEAVASRRGAAIDQGQAARHPVLAVRPAAAEPVSRMDLSRNAGSSTQRYVQ